MKMNQKSHNPHRPSSRKRTAYFKKLASQGTKKRPTPEQREKWLSLKQEICSLIPDVSKHGFVSEAKTALELVLFLEMITPKMFKAGKWYASLCHFNTIGAPHRSRSLQEELRNFLGLKFVSEEEIEKTAPYERQWRKSTQILLDNKLRNVVDLIACQNDMAALKFMLTCTVSQHALRRGLRLLGNYFEQDPL